MAAAPGLEQAIALRRWRRDSELTRRAAAVELGISERMLAYYETGQRPVPRTVMLAARALAAGLDAAADEPGYSRERWVTLVHNLLDYGAEIPVVGRMLKARDRQGLADFLAFVRRGPDPSLALTDPALFRALRAAVTRAQLAGLARYHVNHAARPGSNRQPAPGAAAIPVHMTGP